jgi:hypothetical protein
MDYGAIVENALIRAQADDLYLLLDCSNDPLTDTLHGPGFDTLYPTELVTNGDFATASDWDFGGDWSWNAGGYAQVTGAVGASGNLSPSAGSEIPFVIGNYYLLMFNCSNLQGAEITASGGGVTFPTTNATGIKTFVFQATATTDLNFFGEIVGGAPKNICRLDDVSVLRIGLLRGYSLCLGMELTGALDLAEAGTSDIGQDGVGIRRIYLDNNLPTGSALAGSGLICKYASGDMFIGNDPIFTGYYVQKTVVHDSTAADNSDDYTNLYQGDQSYQAIALMYAIEYAPADSNGIVIGGSPVTDPCPIWFGARGFANAFELRLDATNTKFIIGTSNASIATFVEFGLGGTDPALRPDTDGLIDLGDATNVLRWRHLYLTGNAQMGGDLDHDGSNVGFYGTAPTTQPAALTAALTQITHTGPSTPDYSIATPIDSGVGSAWGFSTQDEFETVMSVVLNLQTRVDELESKLQSLGLLA